MECSKIVKVSEFQSFRVSEFQVPSSRFQAEGSYLQRSVRVPGSRFQVPGSKFQGSSYSYKLYLNNEDREI
jgi:hypothetical protein